MQKYEEERNDVEKAFKFLQGIQPEGYRYRNLPSLSPDQAWSAIHFIQNMHTRLSDEIERCDVCGDIFHSATEGRFQEEGALHHFCGSCEMIEPEPEQECEQG